MSTDIAKHVFTFVEYVIFACRQRRQPIFAYRYDDIGCIYQQINFAVTLVLKY